MEEKQKPIDPSKIYPTPADQSMLKQEQQSIVAMAELEILKAERAESVLHRNPEVRNIALLLAVAFGITLFGQITSLLILGTFNDTNLNLFSAFVSSNGFFGVSSLLLQVILIIILLFTRNISHAKTVIIIAGVLFGITVVRNFLGLNIGPAAAFNLTTLIVNFLIFRKIYEVYLKL